ncbi:MAG TPA: glycoside hydrolase family 130 protein [Bryobacteraceae bacterium]|nr:glycoside hydrolase family 130 protein [Bryobacteraceae bacterium]
MLPSCAWLLALGALLWQIGPFRRPVTQPVITPIKHSTFEDPITGKPVRWEALHTFNPAAAVKDGKIEVLYRAEDDSGAMQIGMHTSRLGLAESSDGIHFARQPEPVFFPANDDQKSREWPGGVEDPRLVESEDGTYYLTYTQWNRQTYDIGIASSRDLVHWRKYGPVFSGKYSTLRYKSGGIVTRIDNDRLVAAKIAGKYWMFWGEGSIHLATSPDLIHWTPVETPNGDLVNVLNKRPGRFDSSFPETGPPPVLTARGIVVLYNGKNSATNAYGVGEALFAKDNPQQLLERTLNPVLQPQLPFEKSGQYVAGTTFAEGLVLFHQKWFLYYGCADSFVGVAISTKPT